MNRSYLIAQAKKRGTVTPQPCAVCGSTDRPQAHHEDYTRPYEVTWLCPTHHSRIRPETVCSRYMLKWVIRRQTGLDIGDYLALRRNDGRTLDDISAELNLWLEAENADDRISTRAVQRRLYQNTQRVLVQRKEDHT